MSYLMDEEEFKRVVRKFLGKISVAEKPDFFYDSERGIHNTRVGRLSITYYKFKQPFQDTRFPWGMTIYGGWESARGEGRTLEKAYKDLLGVKDD